MLTEVWATPVYSPLDISFTLKRFGISHSVVCPDRTQPDVIVNCRRPQPRWVYVSNSAFRLDPSSVNLISASYAELSMTNFPRFPDLDLVNALRLMLTQRKRIEATVTRMSPMDYVNAIVQPSLLNLIQTEYYRIQPYSLRKEAEALIFQFFRSEVTLAAVITSLQRSLKTERLIPLLEQGNPLKKAVARALLQRESVEDIALDTGISSFDLMYLTRDRKAKTAKERD